LEAAIQILATGRGNIHHQGLNDPLGQCEPAYDSIGV
jgi:hypothetical protein